ncbi:hypothetical protein [Mesorhizobium comanense]|uniref:hypothetical protein n=1 Tax=Mesorhizobium comanense TaxID=2502215 RepID=UPI001484FD75|nr:hypothetical protein [Mesorhizobium comanense]
MLLKPAPLDLRVNPIKVTREVTLGALRNLGLQARASALAPHGRVLSCQRRAEAVSGRQ